MKSENEFDFRPYDVQLIAQVVALVDESMKILNKFLIIIQYPKLRNMHYI